MNGLSYALMLIAGFGAVQAMIGLLAVCAFAMRRKHPVRVQPPVTVLKPVCGDEPLLEEALASICAQNYPGFQILIGSHDRHDPALLVADRLRARFPHCDITVIADPARHGANGKISNLMNMLPHAKHDTLVFADSDLHVAPDYLTRVMAALDQPGTGLVTTICGGEPAAPGIAAQLGAAHISHTFLPGALLAVALGRNDCLGCTMALRRDTLERVGGLPALVGHLADDNVLGRRVLDLGLAIRIADTLPVVTVQEKTLHALWLHELRWARTIGALVPVAYAASALQYPMFWSLLAVLVSRGSPRAVSCFAAAWAIRAAVAWGIDLTLREARARPAPTPKWWVLPARDLMSIVEIATSYWSDVVVWRGRTMHADRGNAMAPSAPIEVVATVVEDATLPA